MSAGGNAMTLEPALSQRAAAVMAALADLDQVPDAAAVLAEIDRHGPNPGAALAGRLRVESRGRAIPGWPATVTWEHVGRMRARWEPWDEPHLVLNTLEPVQASVDRIVSAVQAAAKER
jgi:hypothetical protein